MAIVGFLKVLFALTLVLFVLPRWVIKPSDLDGGPIERLGARTVRMCVLLIVVVHALAVLRIFQWTGLVLTLFAVAAFRQRWFRKDRWHNFIEGWLCLMEACSDQADPTVRPRVVGWLRSVGRRASETLRSIRLRDMAVITPLLAVLVGSLVLRA